MPCHAIKWANDSFFLLFMTFLYPKPSPTGPQCIDSWPIINLSKHQVHKHQWPPSSYAKSWLKLWNHGFFTADQIKLIGEVSSSLGSISHWGLFMDWLFPLTQSTPQHWGKVLLKSCNIRNPEVASLLAEKPLQDWQQLWRGCPGSPVLQWVTSIRLWWLHGYSWGHVGAGNPRKVRRSRMVLWDQVGTSGSPGWSTGKE